jgi:predicted metal-dependent phosphoesterase TrpH
MDCSTPLEKIISRCVELGINCIAIADHGTAEGALKLKTMAPFTVIVAEEIMTHHGEIMGMFLNETIPSHISVEEAISRIRDQGGLVNIPHPFETIRGSALNPKVMEEIVAQIDVMEVLNSRTPFSASSVKALEFARKYDIAQSAGSDAHTVYEIGNAYVEMPEFNGKDDFLKALGQGKIHGHKTNLAIHLLGTMARLKKKFRNGR